MEAMKPTEAGSGIASFVQPASPSAGARDVSRLDAGVVRAAVECVNQVQLRCV